MLLQCLSRINVKTVLVTVGPVAKELTALIQLDCCEMSGLVVDNDPKAPPLTRVKLFVFLEEGVEFLT